MAHESSVNCLKLLNDGSLVSGSDDRTLIVWNITNVSSPDKISTFDNHKNKVKCIDQLNQFTVVSGDSRGDLYVWVFNSGDSFASKTNGQSLSIQAIKSLSNSSFASGDADGNVNVWNVTNGKILRYMSLVDHSKSINSLEILSSGNLASVSDDGYAIVWNVSTKKIMNKFIPIDSSISTCFKQLSNGVIVYAGDDINFFAWNVTEGLTQKSVSNSYGFDDSSELPCKQMILYNSSLLAYITDDGFIRTMNVSDSSNMAESESYVLKSDNYQYQMTCMENLSKNSYFLNLARFIILGFLRNP